VKTDPARNHILTQLRQTYEEGLGRLEDSAARCMLHALLQSCMHCSTPNCGGITNCNSFREYRGARSVTSIPSEDAPAFGENGPA
jgi:hypothetical protein